MARINSADEHKPCATIIIRDPYRAQWEFDIVAAKSNPMCPTDE